MGKGGKVAHKRAQGLYLYQAIQTVLRQHNNMPMSIEDIADAINQQGLYFQETNAYRVGYRTVSDVAKGPTHFEVLIRLRER
jgi:hypothetical protein